MTKILLFVSFFILSSIQAYDYKVVDEYLKIHQRYTNEVCARGTNESYNELYRTFLGDGNFIPTTLDDKVDVKTINALISLIDDKIKWLNKNIEMVNNLSDFKITINSYEQIKTYTQDLNILHKNYVFKNSDPNSLIEASLVYKKLVDSIKAFSNSAPFLMSFKFPVDHMNLRSEYERNKDILTKESRSRTNLVFFYRKVVQDGAYDESGKSDALLRAAFDTMYSNFVLNNKNRTQFFLTDYEKLDLNYFLRNFEYVNKLNKEKLLKNLNAWRDRVVRAKQFYAEIIANQKNKKLEDAHIKELTSLMSERSKSLYNLKDFVLKKEAEAYTFWSKELELFKSLFVIETILYSEVGRLDPADAFFRRDITQVVLNRIKDKRFNLITKKDAIFPYLKNIENIEKENWLNVLFKEGEFSFTYFYFPGNTFIYCPDQGRIGKYLRKENLKIALEAMKNPNEAFSAVRYYSRVSMFGRIPMDKLWSDYTKVEEYPGGPVQNPKKIFKYIEENNFDYLYSFKDKDQKEFHVILIKGKGFVIDKNDFKKIYVWRNPHLFRFFSSSNSLP